MAWINLVIIVWWFLVELACAAALQLADREVEEHRAKERRKDEE